MNATLPAVDRTPAVTPGRGGRAPAQRVLQIVATAGPGLAPPSSPRSSTSHPAGIRRHLGVLEADGPDRRARGRPGPARGRGPPGPPLRRHRPRPGRAVHRYSDLASAGAALPRRDRRAARPCRASPSSGVRDLEERYAAAVDAAGDDVAERVRRRWPTALTADGYAASAAAGRPAASAMQLCQGHCPVQHVAARVPRSCARPRREAFSRLLGVHVQRLATLADGGHVCTTHIPSDDPTHALPTTALSVEGQSA